MAITVLETTGSTNEDAKDRSKYRHGDVVMALEQTAGRGQRGHKWESKAGENLTFSLVLEPAFMNVAEQFLLSESVALSIVDLLADFGIKAMIKWTNDIYVGDKKICGVMIEHDLNGARLARTIVGIGLNVNQKTFAEWLPNPTSMVIESGREHTLAEVMEALYDKLMYRYGQLEADRSDEVENEYRRHIYRLDEPHTFALPSGERFTGTIRGVRSSGALIVERDGERRNYLFKEIEFVIDKRG